MLETITNIYNNEIFQIILKLVMITFLAGIVGIEREMSNKPAGFRTHVLVGISAVLIMVCSIKISEIYGNNDPLRMPAQLLSGIGFIGAGTILSNGFKVKGLTTASGLLAITCIGLTVGASLYVYAIIATVIVFVVLKYSYFMNTELDHVSEVNFKVITDCPKELLEELNVIFLRHDVNIIKVKVVELDEEEGDSCIVYNCKVLHTTFNKNSFITDLVRINKVKQIIEL